MRGKRGIKVFMLSPHQKMSPFQRAQMFSLDDPNIFNIAIEGMFDDCQNIVKAVSNDAAFKARYRIGTVNSINWSRLMAQVVYYFKGYFAVTRDSRQEVSFAVPSGNFGNICAGHIARSMGLTVRKLVLATNENDVLDEFFRTGTYAPRGTRDTHATSSPSMDISRASNFERYVFRPGGPRPRSWSGGCGAEVEGGGRFDLARTGHFAKVPENRVRFRPQQPRRPAADHPPGLGGSGHRGGSAHRRRHQGGPGAPRARRAHDLPGDRPAHQVRGDPPGGPGAQARLPGQVPRPGGPPPSGSRCCPPTPAW